MQSTEHVEDPFLHRRSTAFFLVLVLSFFTYAYNFGNPPALFWDENYHIASAQKYINHISFMEPHPPLGKLFVALGEVLLKYNVINNQFIDTDYATNPPPDFSFVGYRLFPTLFGWWSALLFFGILLILTRRTLWATLFSLLYIFDNALIVHSRAAMLDSTMMFFALGTILAALLAVRSMSSPRLLRRYAILFGMSFACLATTKLFGLILVFLVAYVCWSIRSFRDSVMKFLGWATLSFIVVYLAVWWIHFALGTTVNPRLPNNGFYQFSQESRQIIQNQQTASPAAFPVLLRDALQFVSHYEAGVPRLNLAKKDENGSPWFYWPFGGRTINYRWETPNGKDFRYLYLVSNPVNWVIGLVGIILAAFFILSRILGTIRDRLKHEALIVTFFGMYVCYLIAISRIDRVLYLYHYFLPLIFSYILFVLCFDEVGHLFKRVTERHKEWALLTLAGFIFISFQFIHPFSYYELMSDRSVQRRSLLKIWNLHCVHCEITDPLVVPKD